MKNALKKRPAEAVSWIVIATPVYGFLVERGVSDPLAAVVGAFAGLLPVVISETVDLMRRK